jgi:putative CocE/NonD family hydrolase
MGGRPALLDGKVGMVGQSYLALVQYYAASLRPPHLRVAAPVSGPVSYFENFAYRRGAPELGWMLAYFMFMARDTMARKGIYEQHRERLDSYVSRPDIPMAPLKRDAYQHLPVRDWGERLKDGAPYLADYLRHWTDGTYWAATDLRPRFGELDTPMFHVGSWYDVFQYDTIAMYLGMRDGSQRTDAARAEVADGSVGASAALLDPDLARHWGYRFRPRSGNRTARVATAMVRSLPQGNRQRRARGAAGTVVCDG